MSRDNAIDLLCSYLAGAPNTEHYRVWLTSRSDAELSELAGVPVTTEFPESAARIHGTCTVGK